VDEGEDVLDCANAIQGVNERDKNVDDYTNDDDRGEDEDEDVDEDKDVVEGEGEGEDMDKDKDDDDDGDNEEDDEDEDEVDSSGGQEEVEETDREARYGDLKEKAEVEDSSDGDGDSGNSSGEEDEAEQCTANMEEDDGHRYKLFDHDVLTAEVRATAAAHDAKDGEARPSDTMVGQEGGTSEEDEDEFLPPKNNLNPCAPHIFTSGAGCTTTPPPLATIETAKDMDAFLDQSKYYPSVAMVGLIMCWSPKDSWHYYLDILNCSKIFAKELGYEVHQLIQSRGWLLKWKQGTPLLEYRRIQVCLPLLEPLENSTRQNHPKAIVKKLFNVVANDMLVLHQPRKRSK
jgi:hypothetical protein